MAAGKRVMIVEDDPAIAELLARTLDRFYEVHHVNDGARAVHMAAALRPEVILLDVNLPNLDGFAIAQQLKELPALAKIPIIFLTARDRSLDVVRGIQAGAKHYITKPFKIDEVLKKVQKLAPP